MKDYQVDWIRTDGKEMSSWVPAKDMAEATRLISELPECSRVKGAWLKNY